MSHEPLLTSVVGSHAHPGWFVAGIAAAERGEFGPADLAEMLDDAVDLAIRDQEQAGIDVISDGEMRRAGFFTAEFYRHLTGVRALPPDRRLGRRRPRRAAPVRGRSSRSPRPTGSASSREYTAARRRTTRPLKVTLPGPYTLSGRLRTGPGEVYETRVAAAEAFVPILAAELRGLVDAGADDHPDRRAVAGDPPRRRRPTSRPCSTPRSSRPSADVRLGAHLCFGNFLGRPLAPRSYRPILDAMLGFAVDELVLEFANREMAEIELLREITDAGTRRRRRRHRRQELARRDGRRGRRAGSTRSSRPASRPSACPRPRLRLQPDRPISPTAKLRALVAGRDLVRGRLEHAVTSQS